MTPGDSPAKDHLDKEVESALDGVNLQELDASGSMPSRTAGGERLMRGVIVGVHKDDVIVELGPRMQGAISAVEFDAEPKVGDTYEFTLRGKDGDLWMLSRKEAKALAAWDELQEGSIAKATVTGQNTGGLELKIGPIAAFMPASHAALHRVEDLSTLIGDVIEVQVLEVNRDRKRVLVSRRKVLEKERDAERSKVVGTLTAGQKLTGKVTRVEAFGAFVDVGGGLEGLVHVSNMSRQRVEDPNEFVKGGQQVEVMVLEIKEGGKRIGLGMKQLEPDPWDEVGSRLAPDQVVPGKVVRLMDFGAFVEVLPGVEGLLHVSQIGRERLNKPGDVLKVGEEVTVRVLSIDPSKQRISLSRLDPRGAVIGSEDAVDGKVIDEVIEKSQSGPTGTNLGNLFKKALENKGDG